MRIPKNIVRLILMGKVGVMPTDTIYGLVGSALNKKAVEKIYKLRRRDPKKPLIILIGDMRYATWDKFGARPSVAEKRILRKVWPGKVSVILQISDKRHGTSDKLKYLHRGTKTLAFRLPKPYWLRKLLAVTGPLAAPSANLEGMPPARTIKEAKKYFGKRANFYMNGGRISGKSSKLLRIKNNAITIIRN